MVNIRIGNDIPLVWKFFYPLEEGQTERAPYNLAGKDLRLTLTVGYHTTISLPFTVSRNEIHATFYGKDQQRLGPYTLTLEENAGRTGMHTVDKITPFTIVRWQEKVQSGTVDGCVSTLEVSPLILESELTGGGGTHPYLSLERLRPYLYRVSFDSLPEDNGGESPVFGGCSSFVLDGELCSNLDWGYSEIADVIVRTKGFEGMSFIDGLNDGSMDDNLIAQLPYRVRDGRNNNGIMMATHVLYNDWGWTGCGNKSIPLTRLPFLILTRVKSMATIESDLAGVLDNLYAPQGLADMEYLLQIIVTDGTTTYVLMPPTSDNESYILQDISSNPKLANFRWVNSAVVERTSLQNRPTGVERWNHMPCPLSDLRFTKAYEQPTRLSEFIGLRNTTKDSSDAVLTEIYEAAREIYLERERNGQTWQTMHSVVYGTRMESLYIQENWSDNCVASGNGTTDVPLSVVDGLICITFNEE